MEVPLCNIVWEGYPWNRVGNNMKPKTKKQIMHKARGGSFQTERGTSAKILRQENCGNVVGNERRPE